MSILNSYTTAYYELRVVYIGETVKLVIDIHRRVWDFIRQCLLANPVTNEGHEGLGIPDFISHFSEESQTSGWGFGKVLFREMPIRDNWLSFSLPIPPKANREQLFSISATLQEIFGLLFCFNGDITDYYMPQLVVIVGISTRARMHGGEMELYISKAMAEWLRGESRTNKYPPAIRAMEAAYLCLESKKPSRTDFRADIFGPHHFSLSVPGNSCELHPDSLDDDSNRGFKIVTHNVDGPGQQLLLLAGLFAICGHVRAFMHLDNWRERISAGLRKGDLTISYEGIPTRYTELSDIASSGGWRGSPFCGVEGEVTREDIEARYGKK